MADIQHEVPYSHLLGRSLIVLSLPAAIFWFPVLNLPSVGNVSGSDAVFMALWVVTLVSQGNGLLSHRRRQAFVLLGLVLLVGLSSMLGTLVSNALYVRSDPDFNGNLLKEFAFYLKQFGLAAILPLAMSTFASTRSAAATKWVLAACSAAMLFFALFPELLNYLPVSQIPIDEAGGQFLTERVQGESRNTGAISNPNDFAYIMVMISMSYLALAARGDRNLFAYPTVYLVLAGMLATLALSASRSGLLGFLAAFLYLLLDGRQRILAKIAAIVAVSLCLFVLFHSNELFSERMSSAYVDRLDEANVASRLDAQHVCIRAWMYHPFGVGYLNLAPATRAYSQGSRWFSEVQGSDSIYTDTLLGAGIQGLGFLLWLYAACWRHVGPASAGSVGGFVFLRAGCIAVFTFGLATIIPKSTFVGPFFFFMLGCASLLDSQSGRPRNGFSVE